MHIYIYICKYKNVNKIINNFLSLSIFFLDYCTNLITPRHLCQRINSTLNLTIDSKWFTEQMFEQILQRNIKLMPGVENLVKHLYIHKIPMAVCTGSFRAYYEKMIGRFGDFFPKYFTHSECERLTIPR